MLAKQRSAIAEKINEKKKSLGSTLKEGMNNSHPQKKPSTTQGESKSSGQQAAVSSLDQINAQMQKLAKNLANPKDKEKYLELKEKYYREFLLKIN